jgi:hypothetical protein
MLSCMRTTVNIDDELLAQAKAIEAATGKTVNAVVDEALRARRRDGAKRLTVPLPSFGGSRLRPGVDLDDSAALLDLMEGTQA